MLPTVSVIIPCRDEEKFIGACLESVVQNDYPRDRIEVLVVDGMSADRTRSIVEAYARSYSFIRLLDNPRKITPAALNRGIENAKGTMILRLDAHSRVEVGYIRLCVKALDESGANNVGGSMRTLPQRPGLVGQAIAHGLSHSFGSGNSDFRVGRHHVVETDTVFGGCYRREIFESIGLFNERLPRSQDIEFNQRLRKAGGRIMLDPRIVSYYYVRGGLRSFWSHNFRDGVWAILPFAYSEALPITWRHMIPLAFVSGLIGSTALALIATRLRWLNVLATVPYALTTIAVSLQVARRERDIRYLAIMPIVFAIRHVAYGLGSCWGLVRLVGVTLSSEKRPRTPST